VAAAGSNQTARVSTSQFVINPSTGNVGIGTTSPTEKLDVTGTVKATGFSGPINGTVGATTPSTGAFTTLTTSGTIVNSQGNFDALTFTGSNSNAIGFRIQNAHTGANNWNVFGSGGGPAPVGSFGVYDDTIGVTRMDIAKTTGSTVFSGGINSTTIGATTPSTGAFTTGTFGPLGSGTHKVLITDNDQSNLRLRFQNTGPGGQTWSIVGGSPGASNAGLAVFNETGSATVAQFTSTGLAVTGALSSTTTLQAKQSTTNPASTGALPGLSMGFDAGAEVSWIQSERNSLAEIRSLLLNPNGGNVGIGTSSPATALSFPIGTNKFVGQTATTTHQAGNAGSIGFGISDGGDQSGVFVYNTHNGTFSSQDIRFLTAEGGISLATERMRIDSTGNVGIGTSSPISKLTAAGSSSAPSGTAATGGIQSWNNGLTQMVLTIDSNSPFTSTIQAKHLSVDDAYYPISLNPLGGNVGIGTTDQFGGGAKVVGIANADTVPASNPTGGGVLYVEAGALKYRGSSGTVTTIANA
jgi:hypothetical protein